MPVTPPIPYGAASSAYAYGYFSNTVGGRQEVRVDQIFEKLLIRHFHLEYRFDSVGPMVTHRGYSK